MNELLNLKVEISHLDLKENTISTLLTSANKVQEEIERLNNNLQSLYKSLEIIDSIRDENVVKMQIRNLLYNYKELKGEK